MLAFDHFGGGIAGRTALSFKLLVWITQKFTWEVGVTEAEVDDLYSSVEIYQNIFGFQVAVGNPYLVQVLNSIDKLLEYTTGLCFGEPPIKNVLLFILEDVVEQFAAWHVLGDEKQALFRLDDLV